MDGVNGIEDVWNRVCTYIEADIDRGCGLVFRYGELKNIIKQGGDT